MVSRQEALAAGEAFLKEMYGIEVVEKGDFFLELELTVEHSNAWTLVFDTREHKETGNPRKAPLSRVIIVPKDGHVPFGAPTATRVKTYLAQVESGEATWPS
jgi:Immunity protein 35